VKFSDFFIAAGSIASALRVIGEGLSSLEGNLGSARVQRGAGPQFRGAGDQPSPQATRHRVSGDIGDRIRHIKDMVNKSVRDARVREFAVRAVSSRCGRCPSCRVTNVLTAVRGGVAVKGGRAVRGKVVDDQHWQCGNCGETHGFNATKWCIPEKDWQVEVESVFNVVRDNVRYAREGPDDTYQHARRTLDWGGGDCDDYTIVLCSLLKCLGYPVKMRTMWLKDAKGKPAPSWGHIMMLVGLPPRAPTGWLPLDASLEKPPGWYPPKRMIHRTKDWKV